MKILTLHFSDRLDDYTCKSLLSRVDEAKREKLLKFVFWEDLQRGLLADLLVRKVLIDELNLSNEEINFAVSEYGKPYCDFPDDFHFNVSHSGNWVVCVVDKNPVGIDIEKISTIDLDISKNFFSDKEHDDLMRSSNPFEHFFTLWSLKESYIKFIGKGLSYHLNCFSMSLASHSRISIEVNNTMLENIYFKLYSIDDGYKMAVCASNQDMPEQLEIYSVNDLVDCFILNRIKH